MPDGRGFPAIGQSMVTPKVKSQISAQEGLPDAMDTEGSNRSD